MHETFHKPLSLLRGRKCSDFIPVIHHREKKILHSFTIVIDRAAESIEIAGYFNGITALMNHGVSLY
jgi:hypothetical protein